MAYQEIKLVDPRFRSLTVALAPQPRQMPPVPFDHGALQQIFAEITQDYPYQQFSFLPTGRGAQFHNGPEDAIELRPALLQIQAKMNGPDLLTAPMAGDKVTRVFSTAAERLDIPAFVQCAIQIVAAVDAPEDDAKKFIEGHMLHDSEQSAVLGDGFFGGGVKFRRIIGLPLEGEENLNVEPDVNDNKLLFIDFQSTHVALRGPISLEDMSSKINDAFDFVAGNTMQLLER
ncbi:MAG TPA: hypothetical protein VGI24_10410 [Solirubrobacteraceae bacterium]